ncbi:trans-aconitate methyltransferase [Stenotrophomonas chelatiphaga]|jgi:trans-aconitate methyltransferase|uniref:Trans-aconitate methyltransferase n=1 Tax=Stenotrophomonas chelatiphaga TaxID=517011 RepID=A0A0R0D4C8_9GAMM|nr:class I SAM-dependent methyltransferase [Stenotrophomonas chelatiphaga]KRG72435.1 trans-aconitate methyltransferase [Stenotrophomonas chelatiphaga]
MSAFTSATVDAGQTWDAQDYAIDAGFVPVLGSAIARLLDARPGERILDLGCGDGVLSTELALTGAQVIGVDASPELVIAARARGVDAQVMDGHALAFDGGFDAVFSNAALHWMREPDRVLAGVRRALKPGGRLVAEFGGDGNIAAIVGAVQAARVAHGHGESPFSWYFPSVEAYSDRLRQHGFHVQFAERVERPTPLPTGIAGWLRVFAAPLLADLDSTAASRVRVASETLLAELPRDASGLPLADYVRLRVLARRR